MFRRTTLMAAVGAIAAALLMQPVLLAKPGVITTSDGSTFVGDIDDTAADKVVVKDGKGPGIEISKANVKTTKYFEGAQDEYDARMAALAPNDAKGRVAVARWAIANNQPALARQAIDAALKIEPTNFEAKGLLKTLDAPKPGAPEGDGKAPPATGPGSGGIKGKTRLVTKEEINRIRQLEWQPNEDTVRVMVDKDVKATFIARSRDLKPQDFNRMTPVQQAREILKNGTPKMHEGVHLASDPASMANYKKTIQKLVVTGCAATGCHDDSSKTSFVLHTEATDEAAYTNFLVLQNYRTSVDKVERLMVDRDQPADSLLSEYMLAPKVANTPHPKAEGFAGMFKNVQDPRFKMLTQWLRSVPTIPPTYDIDLSQPPKAPEGSAPADAPGDAPVPTAPADPAKGAGEAPKDGIPAPAGGPKMEK